MKVVISTDPIQAPMTGIGEYTLRLIEALLENGEPDITMYELNRNGINRLEALPEPLPDEGVTRRRLSRLLRMARTRALLRPMEGAVYHEASLLPAICRSPTVMTVHDLSHLYYPECHPTHRVVLLRHLLPVIARRVDAIITPTSIIAEEVYERLGVASDRIHAVHHGVDAAFQPLPNDRIESTLQRHGLRSGQYLLCIATLEPRKNLGRLLSAHETLPRAIRTQYPLVIAGAAGWRHHSLLKRIRRLEEEGTVRHLGYVDANDRPALYSGALGFAYPALYEGFGLPPLEAMACGTPVLTSNRSAMPEVVGQAALMVNPESPDAIADGLQQLCTNDALRSRLSTAGRARAAQFSWRRCARETAQVYRAAAA